MTTLADQVRAYGAYHGDLRNKITHFFGVPLVTFSIFLFLGWLRFVYDPAIPFTGATLFYLIVFIGFLRLDWRITLAQAPFTLSLLVLADWIAQWQPFSLSLYVFLGTFIGGWIIQLIGHAYEGKRPALLDNIMQIFNAPLFLTVEVAWYFGLRKDLSAAVESANTSARTNDASVYGEDETVLMKANELLQAPHHLSPTIKTSEPR